MKTTALILTLCFPFSSECSNTSYDETLPLYLAIISLELSRNLAVTVSSAFAFTLICAFSSAPNCFVSGKRLSRSLMSTFNLSLALASLSKLALCFTVVETSTLCKPSLCMAISEVCRTAFSTAFITAQS